ncbi:acyl-homoserine-lactone synthase [Jhaorihella thermophila]|uniref:acyl-homoserine-lactone synthase n=1 Tax=Jhaorihella thermophila TaxID=488547 RepID=A0A1H5RNU2_9RHOB|nr:acyl-homoserine-lactone synthase [Jhaorihella thermophila]SEF39161.1 N-acyl-L-homoserine lactone synthetase [Jhaorihella thermophila]
MKHSRQPSGQGAAALAFPELTPVEPSARRARGHPLGESSEIRVRPKGLPKPGRQPDSKIRGHLRASVLSFTNMHEYGELLVNYLRARHEVFIERLKWNVPETEGMEFDQYDTPMCRWAIVHEYGEVLAGVRMMPTTAKCGIYTYMLRDAQRGLLEGIPNDVLFFEAPVENRVWEASRLFITDAVPAHRRHVVQAMLMEQMSSIALQNGATHVIGIVPAVFSRWLRRLGLDAVPVGPRFQIDGTSSQAALFAASQMVLN